MTKEKSFYYSIIYNIYDDYSSYKFYILNKNIINSINNNNDINKKLLFINSFNYFIDRDTLNREGFASINSLSRAIFNLTLSKKEYNLVNLEKTPLIAIQAHIYFIDLFEEIMDNINNMPVKYDLYITTTSQEKKDIIENYLKIHNKADKYEILVVKNKGRDVLPFILQMKKVYKHYKYFCHIHSKKNIIQSLGLGWRKYLYWNLLGNKEIISEILYSFEINEKLGVIFPENYINLLSFAYQISDHNFNNLNKFLKEIFPSYKLKEIIQYPAGNMFWARVSAVYQVFEKLNFISYHCPKEDGQINGTILHVVERIWLIVAQLNGYDYTTIFK